MIKKMTVTFPAQFASQIAEGKLQGHLGLQEAIIFPGRMLASFFKPEELAMPPEPHGYPRIFGGMSAERGWIEGMFQHSTRVQVYIAPYLADYIRAEVTFYSADSKKQGEITVIFAAGGEAAGVRLGFPI